jgi:5-methylthioadenosine/S-adenosylhomocysteine deaminase
MRTLIRGGWVVGFAGSTHTLWREGVVVVEGDRVLHVGERFDGTVDREIDARGKLVAPGLLDTHVHAGHRAAHRLFSDGGRADLYGQPFLEVAVPREGTRILGDSDVRPGDAGAEVKYPLLATFTVAECLRNGITTFLEFGSKLRVQEALIGEVDRLGIRAYLGPGYGVSGWVGDEQGRLKMTRDDPAGFKEFEEAKAFIRENDGRLDGRLRSCLAPTLLDTCSPDLLRATRQAADELRVPIVAHAAYSVIEFFEIVKEHRMTPIEYLGATGLLGPDLLIGHGNFVADTGLFNYSGARDLELIAASGATVSHCPVNLVRRARSLDSWERYRKAGINIALGTDTYPRDIIMQMRMASYFGKVLSHDMNAATAGEVFEAATLGSARVLGRDDLGRLAPGSKADVIVIDLGGDTLRYGPVLDPIKALVECGIGDDVEMVMVDGIIRMENRRIPGVDLAAVRREAQETADRIWSRVHEWDPLGRRPGDFAQPSFPMAGG